MAKYDNSGRLDAVGEKDWREALDELTAYLRWRLRGKTQRGAHSERVLEIPALDYYTEEVVAKLIEGDWMWQERYGKAIHVSSGFRCPQLNSLIHGATQSQHLRGEAADIYTDAGPMGNLEVARLIIASGRFDQVILENVPGNQLLPQWIHVSWKRLGTNRREIRKKVIGSNSYPVLTRKEVGL